MTFRPRSFRPAWWAPGPHGQTLAGRLFRSTPALRLQRERWDTPDGDFLDLDFAPEARSGSPLVIVLHGLEGSTRRSYVLSAMEQLRSRGMLAVGLNFRSCSGEPNRHARAYHSGETGDLAFVLARMRSLFPGRPLGVMGFSLGGNVLLKHLGELGTDGCQHVQAAVAVSVPYDLAAGASALEDSVMGRVYARYFLRSLKAKVRAKARILSGLVPVNGVLSATTVREFDELATAPLNGFGSAAHYYDRSSSSSFLERIEVPTLLLHALDDPFLPTAVLPLRAVRENRHLVQGFVPRGGHVGFVEGPPGAPRFWAEEEGARFLELVFKQALPLHLCAPMLDEPRSDA